MAKILCIDDDPDIVESCRVTLTAAGHTVSEASNGEDGYRKAQENNPDMIILDVMMTQASEGFQTAYRFRNDEKLKYTPILMLTSISEKLGVNFSVEQDGQFLPVDDFIHKPIPPKELVETTAKLLALPKEKINIEGKRNVMSDGQRTEK